MESYRRYFRFVQAVLLGLVLLAAGFEAWANTHSHSLWGTHVFRSLAILQGAALLFAVGTRARWSSHMLLWGGMLVVVGLPVLYGLNASHIWREGVGLVPVEYCNWLPASTYQRGSTAAMWATLAVASVLGTGVRLPLRYRGALLVFCCVFAFFIAVWGVGQRLVPRTFGVYEWTGCFVSPNHYAAFCYLVFPVAFTLGAAIQSSALRRGRLSSPAPLFYLLAGLLCWGIVVTGSRAGMGILVLQWGGLLVCLALRAMRVDGNDRDSEQRAAESRAGPVLRRVLTAGRLVCAYGIAMVACLFFLVMRGGLGQVGTDILFRWRVVLDSFRLFGTRPWWGMGPGAFAAVFPYYQSDALADHYFHHAHNEPVQFLAEWGILGAALLCIGIWGLLGGTGLKKARVSGIGPAPDSWAESVMVKTGLLLALAGLVLHSVVDFPLRHPLLLLLAAFWFSVLMSPGWRVWGGNKPRSGRVTTL